MRLPCDLYRCHLINPRHFLHFYGDNACRSSINQCRCQGRGRQQDSCKSVDVAGDADASRVPVSPWVQRGTLSSAVSLVQTEWIYYVCVDDASRVVNISTEKTRYSPAPSNIIAHYALRIAHYFSCPCRAKCM